MVAIQTDVVKSTASQRLLLNVPVASKRTYCENVDRTFYHWIVLFHPDRRGQRKSKQEVVVSGQRKSKQEGFPGAVHGYLP